jgi:hypothetical protein
MKELRYDIQLSTHSSSHLAADRPCGARRGAAVAVAKSASEPRCGGGDVVRRMYLVLWTETRLLVRDVMKTDDV